MDYFHIGLAVSDLDAAMDEIGGRLGLAWREVMAAPVELVDGDGRTTKLWSRFVYSAGGAPAIELLQAVPGSVFEAPQGTTFHHVGYWADSLVTESARLAEGGWPLAATVATPDACPSRFALHATSMGFYVELVDRWFDRPWLRDLLP